MSDLSTEPALPQQPVNEAPKEGVAPTESNLNVLPEIRLGFGSESKFDYKGDHDTRAPQPSGLDHAPVVESKPDEIAQVPEVTAETVEEKPAESSAVESAPVDSNSAPEPEVAASPDEPVEEIKENVVPEIHSVGSEDGSLNSAEVQSAAVESNTHPLEQPVQDGQDHDQVEGTDHSEAVSDTFVHGSNEEVDKNFLNPIPGSTKEELNTNPLIFDDGDAKVEVDTVVENVESHEAGEVSGSEGMTTTASQPEVTQAKADGANSDPLTHTGEVSVASLEPKLPTYESSTNPEPAVDVSANPGVIPNADVNTPDMSMQGGNQQEPNTGYGAEQVSKIIQQVPPSPNSGSFLNRFFDKFKKQDATSQPSSTSTGVILSAGTDSSPDSKIN